MAESADTPCDGESAGPWLAVLNRFAGSNRTRRRIEALLARLEAHGPELIRLQTVPGETPDLIRRALDRGVARAFVFGGDGSVGEVAGALAGTEVPLGVVPTGTTNVVAMELGISLRAGLAVDRLATATFTRDFGTWTADGHTVLLGVSAGFDAEVMHAVSQRLKGRIGVLAIGLAGLAALRRYRYPEFEVAWESDDGERHTDSARFVIASNTRRYAGPIVVLPDADPEDDLLDVMIGRAHGGRDTIGFWLKLFRGGGRQLRGPDVEYVRARKLAISSDGGRVPVQINGDAVGHAPITVVPGPRVRMLVTKRVS